jgi:hypothetical protein
MKSQKTGVYAREMQLAGQKDLLRYAKKMQY